MIGYWQSKINTKPKNQSQLFQNMSKIYLNLNTNSRMYEIVHSIIVSECLKAIEKYNNIIVSYMGDTYGSVILYNLLDQTPKDFMIGDTKFPNIIRGIFIFIGSNLSMNLIMKDESPTNRTIPILHIIDPNDPFAFFMEPYFSDTHKTDIMVMPYFSKSWAITKILWHFMLGIVYLSPSYWFHKFKYRYMTLDTVLEKMRSKSHVVDIQIQSYTLHPFKQVISHYSQYLSNPDVQLVITKVIHKYFNE